MIKVPLSYDTKKNQNKQVAKINSYWDMKFHFNCFTTKRISKDLDFMFLFRIILLDENNRKFFTFIAILSN